MFDEDIGPPKNSKALSIWFDFYHRRISSV